MLAKRCPICGGKPQFVYYCIPGATDDSDGLFVLMKRLECKDCGATVPQLMISSYNAIKYWNKIDPNTGKRCVLQRYGTEDCKCEE